MRKCFSNLKLFTPSLAPPLTLPPQTSAAGKALAARGREGEHQQVTNQKKWGWALA